MFGEHTRQNHPVKAEVPRDTEQAKLITRRDKIAHEIADLKEELRLCREAREPNQTRIDEINNILSIKGDVWISLSDQVGDYRNN